MEVSLLTTTHYRSLRKDRVVGLSYASGVHRSSSAKLRLSARI